MDPTLVLVLVMIGAVIIFIVLGNRNKSGRNVCTRCEGTGEVHEKWPDPEAPNGWHILEGICPKCKGKGRV